MASFVIDDPVHVERDSQQLEGVVAYLGPVKFAEGDDWVGVRLTGSSVGLGKNDGSVKGHNYFTCEPNSGTFVRAGVVSKRSLSRLEELRLKRELATSKKASGSTSVARTAATPTRPTAISSTPARRTARAATASTPATTSSTSAKSRIEELRARREARASETTGSATSSREVSRANSPDIQEAEVAAPVVVPVKPTAVIASDSGATDDRADNEKQKKQVEDLQAQLSLLQSNMTSMQSNMEQLSNKLKLKEGETASLQQSLSKAEQEVHNTNQKVEELEGQLSSKDQKVVKVSSDKVQHELEKLQASHSKLEGEKAEIQDYSEKLQSEMTVLRQDLERERDMRSAQLVDLSKSRGDLSAVQQQLNALNNQTASRTSSDAIHYKERAKLQAEMSALKRTNEQLEREKLDMEATLEDLTLDKEQLLEEKEELEDRVAELRIDSETAQMEVEELRMELEDVKEAEAGGELHASVSAESEDAAQVIATQNSRLREALIRLREQSSFDKVEMSRQLRAAEKAVAELEEVKKELESLRKSKASLEEQVGYLKETVDQGSAFETMVEDLSDRVMALEDENAVLESTLREMEDAADITAELEEVQAEEVKALMMDLEGRDSIIRNLEEAIKMQRRREEDFQRTVVNYRNSVDTLRQEKNELLALQRGGEGEKTEIMATSQKALSRAAQLVADAAKARKREAAHAFKQVDGDMHRHLSERLEAMLPQNVASAELAAIRGELLLCKVVGKASMTLDGLKSIFLKTIRSGIDEATAAAELEEDSSAKVIAISDEAAQDIERVLYETKFSLSTIEMSSELLRMLAAGQWPDTMSAEESAEIASAFLHSLGDLDANMGSTLKILKEEGALSPHRSNLGAFQQSVQTTVQALRSARSIADKPLVAAEWKPPGWQILKDVSTAKFNCLGSGAAVAGALSDDQSESIDVLKASFKKVMAKMEQVASETTKIGSRMGLLDVENEKVVKELEGAASTWKQLSEELVESVSSLFGRKGEVKLENISVCEVAADAVLKTMAQFMSSLRAANLNSEDGAKPHQLSCESKDIWSGMADLTQKVRAIDGDSDDVNFIVRSQSIEQRLSTAVDNEPKLTSANSKVAMLEKNLTSRSKEIAMQNARLSELEKLLAKSSLQGPSRAQKSATVTEELMKLKEENRVLTDAMDVMQQQVDEYEAEIKTLKDPKSPKGRGAGQRGSSSRNPPRAPRGNPLALDYGSAGVVGASPAEITALQATLFRPALESVRREASIWKSTAVANDILRLPPLSLYGMGTDEGESKDEDPRDNAKTGLESARAALRMEKASFRLVDLSAKTPARSQLLESLSRTTLIEGKLWEATAAASSMLTLQGQVGLRTANEFGDLLGRVTFSSGENQRKVPLAMSKESMHLVHERMIM